MTVRDLQIELIRQKCIEANVDLEFYGNRLYRKGELARLHLADVLLAMNTLHHDGSYIVSDAGFFAHFKAEGARIDKAMRVFNCSWNLRNDDLTQQSDDCITFLYDLLA